MPATVKPTPLACPNCGNTSDQEGITFCYLEWRIAPVAGVHQNQIVVHHDQQEGADIEPHVTTTMTNTPNNTHDLQHLFCGKCHHNWFDRRDDISTDELNP